MVEDGARMVSDMARVAKCPAPLSQCEDCPSLFLRTIQSLMVVQESQTLSFRLRRLSWSQQSSLSCSDCVQKDRSEGWASTRRTSDCLGDLVVDRDAFRSFVVLLWVPSA
jgi:hypothetical protein